MLERLKNLIRRLFGIQINPQPREPDDYTRRYEDIGGENITATIANKLAMLTFADSACNIDETAGKRAELIKGVVDDVWRNGQGIVAQVFGKGGKALVPTVNGDRIDVHAIDQNRVVIRRMENDRILDATILSDIYAREHDLYYLLADYSVDDGGLQTIRYRACMQGGAEVSLTSIPKWADVAPEYTISNTDRVLFAFLRCPRDNRRDLHVHGVPITYGVENDIAELTEHIKIYQREYKLSRMMLGLDASLWRSRLRNDNATDIGTGVSIEQVKKTVQDAETPFIPVESMVIDGKTPWQQYAPAIRTEAMETRYSSLLRRVEKACGLSQGILTERPTMNYANRDEVRAAQYDTFSTIKAMRDGWEAAIRDLTYAADVLAERFGLTPAGARGQYEIEYDWDTSMIESSAETFAQLSELQSRGMVSKAELRQWVRGGTLEEAQEAVDEISKEHTITGLFGADDTYESGGE